MSAVGKVLEMPDGEEVTAIYIDSDQELKIQILRFWLSVRCNPMVAFDTEWDCDTNPATTDKKAKISLLKLCNLDKTCLINRLSSLAYIPPVLTKFLAIKDIRFVGVNITKELGKLKGDYGIEIRNAIELSAVAAQCWDYYLNKHPVRFERDHYERWKHCDLQIPRPTECISIPLGKIRLLSAVVAGMKLPSELPSLLLTEDSITQTIYMYLTVSVYAALKVGIKLINADNYC